MSDKPKSKRRNMKSFKLEEISVVDKPAQEGAKMALMKRDGGEDLGTRIIKQYLDKGKIAESALASITKSAGTAKALACGPALVAVETSLRSVVGDHSLNDRQKVEVMKSSVNDFLTFTKQKLPDIETHLLKAVSTEEPEMNLRTLQKQMNALSGKLDSLLASVEKGAAVRKEGGEAEAAARLREALGGAAEKAGEGEMLPFMEEAEKAEDEYEFPAEEETEKAGEDDEYFVDEETEKAEDSENEKPTSEGEEEDIISAGSPSPIGGKRATKRNDAQDDAFIKVDGHTIRKSEVGGGLFGVLKAQQDRVDRLAKQAAEERDLRELVEYAKVAEDELAHLPGTVEEKAVILKQLGTALNAKERALVSRMLKAGNAGISTAFQSVGHRTTKAAAAGSFTKRVNEIRARDNCSHTDAMRKARMEHPDEFDAYQGH